MLALHALQPRALFRFVFATALLASVLLSRAARAEPTTDHELTVVPVVGGSSDVGIGGGYIASYARIAPGVKPYAWHVESSGMATAKFGDPIRLGYFDENLSFAAPRLFERRLHFEVKSNYTIEPRLYYYGIGNAASLAEGRSLGDDHYAFERWHGTVTANARYVFPCRLLVLTAIGYTHSVVHYADDSRLAEDRASSDTAIARVLHVNERENIAEFSLGTGLDTRDDEVSTRSGQFHVLRIDAAPGGTRAFPNTWLRFDADLRAFAPLVPRRLTLAVRGVFDWLTGDVPFSELARAEDLFAVGGLYGVRGVPAGRYQGMVKTFANFELRSELFDFRAFSKTNRFGVTAFFDTGRVFSDFPTTPALDGTGLGLKYGVGAGVRIAAGDSFVLRGDIAWSPDAAPVGAYLVGGQMF